MDALRLERLAWAVVFAAIVAVFGTLLFVPDPTGILAAGVALVVFAVVATLAARFALGSIPNDAVVGDQTARYLVFFVVALALQLGFGALGVAGFAATAVAFGAAWIAAMWGERLNPKRWGEHGEGAP